MKFSISKSVKVALLLSSSALISTSAFATSSTCSNIMQSELQRTQSKTIQSSYGPTCSIKDGMATCGNNKACLQINLKDAKTGAYAPPLYCCEK